MGKEIKNHMGREINAASVLVIPIYIYIYVYADIFIYIWHSNHDFTNFLQTPASFAQVKSSQSPAYTISSMDTGLVPVTRLL